jgi:hypothetical protein
MEVHGYSKYIDMKNEWFCCTKLKVLAKYHDGMDVENGRVSVYAPEDSFWKRQINLQYFEFDYCPYCGRKINHTSPEKPH